MNQGVEESDTDAKSRSEQSELTRPFYLEFPARSSKPITRLLPERSSAMAMPVEISEANAVSNERFEQAYRSASERRSDEQVLRRPPCIVGEPTDDVAAAIARVRGRSEANRVVMRSTGGLRSAGSRVMQMLVAALPKARLRGKRFPLMAGDHKGVLRRADSKFLAAEERYVEFNHERRALFRIDVDSSFEDVDAFLNALGSVDGLPCLPHVVVFAPDASGSISRPHLYFLLPRGSAVWWDETNPKCRKEPRALYSLVVRRATAALIPIGADMQAVGTCLKGKNPLSTAWTALVLNEDRFPTLLTWISTLPKLGSTPLSSSYIHKRPSVGSGGLFDSLRHAGWWKLREWHAQKDPFYLEGLDARESLAEGLAAFLQWDLATHCAETQTPLVRGEDVLRSVVTWIAKHWDPAKVKLVNRGACAAECEEATSRRERHQIGALYAARKNAENSLRILVLGVEEITARGEGISIAVLVRQTGLSKQTVRKHLSAALAKHASVPRWRMDLRSDVITWIIPIGKPSLKAQTIGLTRQVDSLPTHSLEDPANNYITLTSSEHRMLIGIHSLNSS